MGGRRSGGDDAQPRWTPPTGPGGRVEQDPEEWWTALVAACAACAGAGTTGLAAVAGRDGAGVMQGVRAVAFSAARQTFVPVAADGTTLGSAFVWSDRRAGHEAGALAAVMGGEQPDADHHGTNHHGTNQHSTGTDGTRLVGTRLDAGSVAAKMAWLASHEPERLERGALVAGTP